MKIYFSAPITRVDKEARENYDLIVKVLQDWGHSVLADHLMNKDAEVLHRQSREEALAVQRLMARRKRQADLVIFEASSPSFGIGQELSSALRENKPVVVLYTTGNRPHLLLDEGEDLQVFEYNRENLENVLRSGIEESQNKMDVRFNFFVSQPIVRYLDWISKRKKLPRAVFLRGLVEREMDKDKEYQESLG